MLDYFVYGDVSRISPEAPAPVIAVRRAGRHRRRRRQRRAQYREPRRALHLRRRGRQGHGRQAGSSPSWRGRRSGIKAHLVVDPSRPTTRKLRFVSEHHSTHLLRADWELAKPVEPKIEAALIKHALAALPQSRRGGDLRLRQGRADAARHPRGDRPGEEAQEAGGGRSQGQRFLDLSRRDRDHAEPQGTGRSDAHAGRQQCRDRQGGGRAGPHGREPGRAGDAERGGHAAPGARRQAGACSGLSGRGARRIRRRRHGRRGARRHAGDGSRFRSRDARRQRGGCRSRSASAAPPRSRRRSCARGSFPRQRSRPKRRSCSTGARSTGGSTNGARTICASASPMACSTCCIPATSRCWRRRAAAATASWSASTATPRCAASRARSGRSRASAPAPRCWPRSKRSISSWCSTQDTPLELIRRVRPNVLVKGGDYRRDQVVGRELVEAQGGEVVLVDLVPGFSTTRIVERSRKPRRR